MDRDRLDRLMDDPGKVRREDITDLKAMTERYPWFSGAHLLLAVGEHAAGDMLFDEQLRTTAAHLPSRAVLFDHVQQPAAFLGAPVEEVKEEVAPPPVSILPGPENDTDDDAFDAPVVAPAPTVTYEAVSAPMTVVPKEPPPTVAPVPEEVVEERPVSAAVAEPEVEAPEEEAPSVPAEAGKPVAAPDPLDLQIREAALASSYELTWDFEAELAAARSTPVTFEGTPAPAAVPPARVAPAPMEAPVISPSTRKRFTAWLDLAPPAEPADLPNDLRLDQIAPAPDAGDWLRDPSAPAPADAPEATAPSDTKQLIDRFIQQAPVPPVKKAAFFTPQQAAKRSLEDHADLVSETLARVYEKQGNYAKAIAAYERLALKHPDKSAYFAALSEALKARSNR